MRGVRRARTSHLIAVVLVLATAATAGCGVGGDEGSTGAKAINWYAFNEPGGSYDQAVANCNKQANGKYTINYIKLPNIADQQRELLVRRLAAEDDSIDLASLDVIWTAEFAEAEWILPWEGERREAARRASSRARSRPSTTRARSGRSRTRATRSCSGTARTAWTRRPTTSPGTR